MSWLDLKCSELEQQALELSYSELEQQGLLGACMDAIYAARHDTRHNRQGLLGCQRHHGGVCTRSGGRRRGLGRGNCAGELGGRSMFVLGAKSG